MKAFIRNLSISGEFCLVLLITFWGPLVKNAIVMYERLVRGVSPEFVFSTRYGVMLLSYEVLTAALLCWIGRVRGWSLGTFGFKVTWGGAGKGVLLYLALGLLLIVPRAALESLHPESLHLKVAGLTLPFMVVLSIINPIFEEAMETGYFVHRLQGLGMWPAMVASGVFRGMLHLYQGFNPAFDIMLLGMFFAFAYWRWRQLWPLIVAHALLDFGGLIYLNHRS